jgi:hypothetical protein
MTTTQAEQHTHGPNFGRKVADCPRCAQLAAGAPAIEQAWRKPRRFDGTADVSGHFASAKHRSGGCGPVCTFGDY